MKNHKRVASSPRFTHLENIDDVEHLSSDSTAQEKPMRRVTPTKYRKLDSDAILEMTNHRMPKNLEDKEIKRKILDIEHVMEYEGNVRGADLVIQDN